MPFNPTPQGEALLLGDSVLARLRADPTGPIPRDILETLPAELLAQLKDVPADLRAKCEADLATREAVCVPDRARMGREYVFNNLAGCVVQRKSHQTGLLVGLYNAEQAGMDPEAGPWATVCEEHGQLVNHPTLKLAMYHLADPKGWCEVCNGTETNN